MSYCALDEAFLGPAEGILPVKRHKKLRPKETSVPVALPDVPGSVKVDDIQPQVQPQVQSQDQLYGPNQALQAGQKSEEFFPIPGESWESAFMLDSDFTKTIQRPDSSVPVAGLPTLWRESAASQSVQVPTIWTDVNQRLDKLTKQLDKLTMPTQNQSTAELFLFVAIGLIILLAIDTLLRFASSIRGPYESPVGIHTGGWRPRFGKVRFR